MPRTADIFLTRHKPQMLPIFAIFLVVVTIAIPSAIRIAAAPMLQRPARFLSPPYYGTENVNCVYDHEYPTYSAASNDTAPDVVHYDGTRNGAGVLSSYDGHNGIDYSLRYELLRAAATGDIAYAGWDSVTNHRAGVGLYVRIHHSNDYHTIYGHMSVLRVQTDDEIPDDADEFQRIIGVSGNTGWCAGGEGTGPGGRCTDNDPPTCGAHLHFELEPPDSTASVNPYGWIGDGTDPWEDWSGLASHDLWLHYPSITNSDVFTSGTPLTAPPISLDETGYFTIDDGDADFAENPAGCWTVDNTDGWSGDYHYRDVPDGNCTATWNFPQARPAWSYHVFIHIPNDNVALDERNATVDAARYTISHTVSAAQPDVKLDDVAIVNQWAYPNNAHTSTWVYAGTYYFDTNVHGTDFVRLESEAMDPTGTVTMTADAVRFVPVVYRIYLPLVTKRWPPVPYVPVLTPIANPDNNDNYTVSWNPADLADTYTLQEATNASFAGAVTRYSGTGTSWSATNKPVNTYYYRVKATNSWGDSGWSNVQSITVLPPVGWQTIASQDFEGMFPGEWWVFDNNGSTGGEYYWDDRICRAYSGSYSGWSVGGGANGATLGCGNAYPHDANSWLYYGPFDLEDAIAGELVFKLWLYTELHNDYIEYRASVDGVHFPGGYNISGNTQGWNEVTFNLADVPNMGNLLGESEVWVAILFSSNSSVNYAEGGYVDDVVIRECFRGPCPSGNQLTLGEGAVREVSTPLILEQ